MLSVIQAKQGGLTGRPGPAVPGIQNLYVVGDWVGLLGQLSGASLASARQAARMILAAPVVREAFTGRSLVG